MNKYISMLVALMVTLFAANSFAFNPPPAPANGYYVTDLAGKLSESQKTQLNKKIEQVNKATANEFGILLLANMDGANIEDVAYNTFKKWGLGKKDLDNGCLIVVSLAERKSRIETGKGVGGDVPDLVAKDILVKNLNPYLKKGDFYSGFDSTLNALSARVESRRAERDAALKAAANKPAPVTVSNSPHTSNGGCSASGSGIGGGTVFLIALVLGGIAFLVRHSVKQSERQRRDHEAALERIDQARREVEAERQRQQQQLQAERERARRDEERAERERKEAERKRLLEAPTPAVSVPSVPVVVPRPQVVSRNKAVGTVTAVSNAAALAATAAATATAAAAERRRREREEEARAEREAEARRERERQEAERARAARERQEEEARRKRDEESRSSYSSYSSYDSGSSSSYDSGSSSYDSGGSGFGGGDSGGGGSSSDW